MWTTWVSIFLFTQVTGAWNLWLTHAAAPYSVINNNTVSVAANQMSNLSMDAKINIISNTLTILLSIISTLISWASLQQITKSNQLTNGDNRRPSKGDLIFPTVDHPKFTKAIPTSSSTTVRTFDDVNPKFRSMMLGQHQKFTCI
jgi:hypothetical protein